MKKIFFLLFIFISLNIISQINQGRAIVSSNRNKIQIAILFDTSNSMDGLIEQAKARIWQIVNTANSLTYNGIRPEIELALFEYGNDFLAKELNYIRKIVPLSNDIDLVSKELFSLRTHGGQEYCGAVISQALYQLNWSLNPSDLKLIYIAGNEPFNQGNINYKDICLQSAQRDITVNTIYCGDYQQGIQEFWHDGAQIGKGEYSNINSNLTVNHISTPYDTKINELNEQLNSTYIYYGKNGKAKKDNMIEQDKNAMSQALETKIERTIYKTQSSGSNSSWDLVDASISDSSYIKKLNDDELPMEFSGKSESEKLKLISIKKEERQKINNEISDLSLKREEYINEKIKTKSELDEKDFGDEVKKSIYKSAIEKGYDFNKPK